MRKTLILPIVIAALLLGSGLTGSGTVAPVSTAEATTSIVHWGYFTQPGFTDTPINCIGFAAPCNGLALPCTDCYITAVTPDLEYRTVDIAPSGPGPEDTWVKAEYSNGAMLHHFVIGNFAQPDATCGNTSPINLFGDRFFASGDERGTMTLPAGYGYYIPPTGAPNNWWNLQVMIHNLGPSSKVFRLPVTFTWQPATDPVKALTHVWLDEVNCSTSQFGIPVDYSDTHADWTSGSIPDPFTADNIEGTVLAIGGHVHDLGISVSAEKVQTSQWICASTAEYAMGSSFDPPAAASPPRPNDAGHPADANALNPGDPGYNGHIEGMTGCAGTGVIIAPGDTIRLHTQYNPDASACDGSGFCIDDVMGIMAAWIYDNCAAVSNPDQHDNDNDLLGDVCDSDADGDGTLNDTDTDDDGDGALDVWEIGCGTQPLHGGRKQPERLDAVFATTDDDADTLVNEALPAGSGPFDCDGDGYKGHGPTGTSEQHVYNAANTAADQDACGMGGWPADLVSTGPSANKITLTDLSSFVAPLPKKLNTDPGDAGYNVRWDLVPGNGATLPKDIILTDMSNITLLFPPMLGGAKAFGGPVCPWTP